MSFFKLFSGVEKVKKKPCQTEEAEKLMEREELLVDEKEDLKRKIDQELLFAKRNSRTNRRAALQALRRKRWYEKHLKYIDCAVKAMRSTHRHIDITEDQDLTPHISDTLHTSVNFGVEFDEEELLAELQRLETELDETIFEKDRVEKTVPCLKVLSTSPPSCPAKTEEDEVEDDLEYLRRWASEPS